MFFFGYLLFAISLNALVFESKDYNSNLYIELFQDKTVLITKIKTKITALKNKRVKLKSLRKWTPAREKGYQKQLKIHKNNLKKLGFNSDKDLTNKQIIIKLQKRLKYLNNARVNKNARDGMSKKYDSMYKHDAGILLDSIMKLRRKKV